MVLSTLHTNDAASTINRLLDMGVDDYLLTSTVTASQQSVWIRTLCNNNVVNPMGTFEVVDGMQLRRWMRRRSRFTDRWVL